jgi:hypothetical protein
MFSDGYEGIALGVECAWPAAEVRWLEQGRVLEMRDAAGTTVTTAATCSCVPASPFVEACTDASITFSAA